LQTPPSPGCLIKSLIRERNTTQHPRPSPEGYGKNGIAATAFIERASDGARVQGCFRCSLESLLRRLGFVAAHRFHITQVEQHDPLPQRRVIAIPLDQPQPMAELELEVR